MTERDLVRCVGGPWDGLGSALSLNGEVLVRLAAGTYRLDEDAKGAPVYRWEPADDEG